MTQGPQQNKFSPQSLIRAIRRRKLYLLIPVVVLLPAAYFYAQSLPLRYRANASVGSEALIPGQPSPSNMVDPATINAQEQLRAIHETLFSKAVLDTVAQEFGLQNSPASQAKPGPKDVKSNIQIQLQGTNVFTVGFESGNPQQAAQVANRLAALFVERTSDLRGRIVEQRDSVLDAEVDRLRSELTAREDGLRSYKDQVSQELPERLASNLKELENVHQQIQSRTEQIAEAEARRSSITEEMQALEKQGVLQDEAPAKTRDQIALDDLRLKLSQLKTRYTPEHPEILQTQKQIRDLEAIAAPAAAVPHAASQGQLRYFTLRAELKSVESRLASYREEQGAPVSQAKEYERRINLAPGYETAVAERTRDAAMVRTRYEALFAKQQESRLNQRAETVRSGFAYKILDEAQVPVAPFSPHRDRIFLFGLMASFGLGVAGIFLAERLDTTFETEEAFERFSTLPVLSTIPSISGAPASALADARRAGSFSAEQVLQFEKHRLPLLTDPQSIASQQYGILALKVAAWMRQNKGQIMMVTSATGGEGKSLTALNLSLALASSSQGRVLLIDCDLRLPQVHDRLGISPNKGLSDLLAGPDTDPAPYISRRGNLDVIASGSIPANPVSMLASPRTGELLTRLRNEYALIILDSPPVVPIADSHILAGVADGVLLVVRARKTRPDLFQHAIESLGANNLMGVVLNDVEYDASPYAHAYRAYQQNYLGRG